MRDTTYYNGSRSSRAFPCVCVLVASAGTAQRLYINDEQAADGRTRRPAGCRATYGGTLAHAAQQGIAARLAVAAAIRRRPGTPPDAPSLRLAQPLARTVSVCLCKTSYFHWLALGTGAHWRSRTLLTSARRPSPLLSCLPRCCPANASPFRSAGPACLVWRPPARVRLPCLHFLRGSPFPSVPRLLVSPGSKTALARQSLTLLFFARPHTPYFFML